MSIESFIRAMPKVELNIHLEGTMRKETLLTIAEQNDVPENIKHFNQLATVLDEPDYQRLDEIAHTVSQWLLHPEDLTRIVYELGVGLAKQNVRYAEVSINPLLYMEHGLTFEQVLSAINDGRSRVERGWKMRLAWILNVPRDQPRKADDIVRWATSAAAKKGDVVGLGLSGREDAQPAAQFERPFKTAQKKELPRTVQAGDVTGAEGILEVMNELEPNRLVDGWGTADAPDVIKLLTDRHITLDICIARALCLGQVETYAKYPLRDLYDDGITLTINSGMPSFYKTTITDEYLAVVEHGDFSVEELQELALNAVRACFLPDEEKGALLAEFVDEYTRLRAEHIDEAKTPLK
jgi:adenosine deaminase